MGRLRCGGVHCLTPHQSHCASPRLAAFRSDIRDRRRPGGFRRDTRDRRGRPEGNRRQPGANDVGGHGHLHRHRRRQRLPELARKIPIIAAWSTPGAVLIAASAVPVGMEAATGAFLLAAGLVLLTTAVKPLGDLVSRIPPGIAAAMLAGIMLRLLCWSCSRLRKPRQPSCCRSSCCFSLRGSSARRAGCSSWSRRALPWPLRSSSSGHCRLTSCISRP